MQQSKRINNSQLNTSKSKAMFSFPKCQRFIEPKKNNASFYQLSSLLDKRATSLGFGKKTQIAPQFKISPSPDKYDLGTSFEKSPKKGISFGKGRQDIKFVSIFNQNNNPGPGIYNTQNKLSSKQYSIRSKITFPALFENNKVPGPGSYKLQTMGQDGKYLTSKNKNNICYKIHNNSNSFCEKQNNGDSSNNNSIIGNNSRSSFYSTNIGPGTYNFGFSANGKQYLSKKRTQQASSFAKRVRQTLSLSLLAPGPGAYQSFSEFGPRA